jgi:hypothetical protein
MNSLCRLLLLVSAGLVASGPLRAAEAAAAAAVANPAARDTVVEMAQKLVARREPPSVAGVIDPFHPPAFAGAPAPAAAVRTPGAAAGAPAEGAAAAPAPRGPRTDRDILAAIAGSLKPKSVIMGGNAILFFGEKKVRTGDPLVITFEGAVYQLQVTAIDRNNFTLRLNRDEFTRPIKQGTAL